MLSRVKTAASENITGDVAGGTGTGRGAIAPSPNFSLRENFLPKAHNLEPEIPILANLGA